MKELINHIKTDKIIKWSVILSGIVLLLELIAIAIFYTKLPPYLPLFNQMPWGENRLGAKIEFLFPVLTTILFGGINIFLIGYFYTKMPLAARIVTITTFLLTLLSCIFVLRTLLLIV